MKWHIYLFILFPLTTTNAEVFTRFLDKGKSSVTIYEMDKLHINKNCHQHFKNCVAYLNSKVANSKQVTNSTHTASSFCQHSGGHSEIFFDVKNNQYDFCNFEEKYIIDSWDLYNRFKK